MTTITPPPDLEEWQIDGEEFLLNPFFEADPDPSQTTVVVRQQAPAVAMAPPPTPDEPPPSPERIIEAMLFVGGPPLTADRACEALRGLSEDQFRDLVKSLTKKYKVQRRPYSILTQMDGYVLAVKPEFRSIRERLFGGPREARLSQPALDILSLVAYRQPVSKAEIDSLRGADSGGMLRHLVRLGMIAIARRQENGERVVTYGTTPRFLELFQLDSLDDLPRLGEAQSIA